MPAVEYNPEAAAALLAEAGFPNGLSEVNVLAMDADGKVIEGQVEETIPLTLFWQPATRPYNPQAEAMGQAMAADLAAIGASMSSLIMRATGRPTWIAAATAI